jgi:hypothetical protein
LPSWLRSCSGLPSQARAVQRDHSVPSSHRPPLGCIGRRAPKTAKLAIGGISASSGTNQRARRTSATARGNGEVGLRRRLGAGGGLPAPPADDRRFPNLSDVNDARAGRNLRARGKSPNRGRQKFNQRRLGSYPSGTLLGGWAPEPLPVQPQIGASGSGACGVSSNDDRSRRGSRGLNQAAAAPQRGPVSRRRCC